MKTGRMYAVHYGEQATVSEEFVASLKSLLSEKLDLILINNSAKGLLDHLKARFVTILDTGANLGYFGGIRYGMEHFSLGNRNFAVICNNDIRILNPDFMERLDEKLEHWDIIAPSTKTMNGIEQNPHRKGKLTIVRKLYYNVYYTSYVFAWMLNALYVLRKGLTKATRPLDKESAIISPHGACMVLKSTYFERGGCIDDGYFLYGEEDSIGAMAKSLGLKVGFVPSLNILHLESISTGKKLSLKKYHFQKTAYRYIKERYKPIFD